MARKKSQGDGKKGSPEWMSTYGDMVTLLLTFFILLFSMSTIDIAKFKAIVSSFNGSISFFDGGATYGEGNLMGNGISQFPDLEKILQETDKELKKKSYDDLKQIASEMQTYFEQNHLMDKIDIEIQEQFVKLNFIDSILFDSGRAALKPEALEILNQLGDELLKYPANDIKIEGHTDNVPISTPQFPSNWELSAARAISVARFYTDQKGFTPQRLSAEGFGEYRPVTSNDTSEGRAKNRRVEIKILSQMYSGDNLQSNLIR